MRARSSVFLLVGILLAGLTGVGLYQLASRGAGGTPAATANVNVVVARTQLPARTTLAVEMLQVKVYPADLVPPTSFRSVDAVIGLTTGVQIEAGQPLVREQLSAVGSAEATSLVIEPGKVLVAFPTSDPLTVAGLVAVGDHVDLLATVVQGEGENARLTQTTIQDLEVLEVLGPTNEQPQRQRALVFVVDHQVALVLKYLRDAETTVDLVVRSREETTTATTTTVHLEYLMDTYGIER